ncbi:hypothetical protein P154DRAFT_378676, partial [Amniculicola lignicola CBS 123094]
ALAGLVSTVAGHAFITDPKPRMPGDAFKAACGAQMYSNQNSDVYGNIQGELQVAQADYNAEECDIWLCKGFKYDDNTANVQSFTAGQNVSITVDIRAPHGGPANVSIVDTATNTVIGEPLISWQLYGSTSQPIQADQENFSVTIPSTLGSKCSTAGACVIQWFWDSASINQTYESCIDFTVGGSGSDTPTPASSAAPSSSAAAATSVAAEATSPAASATPTPTPTEVVEIPTSTAAPATPSAT